MTALPFYLYSRRKEQSKAVKPATHTALRASDKRSKMTACRACMG